MRPRPRLAIGFCCALLPAVMAAAADLKPETLRAFDEYIRQAQARLDKQLHGERDFLWADSSPGRARKVREGQILTEAWNAQREVHVTHGLIHDWIGAVFVPGATLDQTIALVQDYNHHNSYYKPEVIGSRILSRDGNRFRIHLRLLKKKVLTVVLNTQHDVEYFPLDRTRWHSRSCSTRIAEVASPGKPNERELPVGKDHGFLWRVYSYWRFQQAGGGVFIECRAISLTRSVPPGLAWLIEPIIRNLPRESLSNTLRATRSALLK